MQDTTEAILGFLWVNSYNFASFRHPTTPDISSIPGSTIHEVTPAAIITSHRTAFDMGMALIGGTTIVTRRDSSPSETTAVTGTVFIGSRLARQ